GLGGAHLKHDRSSAPSSPQLAASRSADSTPSKFNFLSRLNKKTKSGTKPEKKTSRNEDGTPEISDGSLRSARSHESLQPIAYDPVHHPSPLQDRARSQVNRDDTRRTENTLMIWIMEAKGIPCKKRYFCTLKLNDEPYRRTFSKQMTNMCFWGEYFELDSLPQVSTICIDLMREADKKPKRIGSVEINITLSSPGRAALIENWYLVKVEKQERDIPSIRIKHKFQSLDILPLSKYSALRTYLKDNSTSLCQLLEPAVSVKAKEDIATTLIHIMQAEQRAVDFLVRLILLDTQKKAESEHLLFRGNSVATKAIEAYMKLVGEQYLQETLSEPIQSLIDSTEDLEVDGLRITNLQSLHQQREALKLRVSLVWEKIIQSSTNFPVELRKVFHTLREHLSELGKSEMTDNLISACVFLRFLCPAILSPSLFNIIQEYPDGRTVRNLTLVTKTLQTLANFTHFQGKENFMEFLNDFISKEQDRCRTFLRTISSSPGDDENDLEFAGDIDLGKHLALLHLHLIEALAKINTQGYKSEASKVFALVDDISTLLGEDYKGALPGTHLATHTPISTPPLVANPSVMGTPTHLNNNYVRNYGDGPVGVANVTYGEPAQTSNKSQSLPRSAAPVYHQQESASPGINSPFREKTAANDLSTSDDYVLITAFDHHTQPQNYMYPSMESNNNNATVTDVRLSNGNSYYMAEFVSADSPPVCSAGSPGTHYTTAVQSSLRTYHHNPNYLRRHPRAVTTTARSHSMSGVLSPMERRGPYQDEISEFYNFMDSCSNKIDAVCMDHENNIQGSQTSISQLSNVASSGYQSFAYSQSSSPVDSLLQTDNASLLSRDNGNPAQPILRQVLHGSPLASPLHQSAVGKHRAVAVHPAYLGHAGHVSLHGTPRHIPRVPQSKGSPNSSLSSSQSVEDLSSLRRGRTRQRRSASSSSDSSPESRPAMHAHSRRSSIHPPRTNPHCSPRLIASSALRQELRSRSRCDRSVSGRRGKSLRSCDREDFTRGTSHCYEDSEDDIAGVNHVSGGVGGGSWRTDVRWLSQDDYPLKPSVAPQQILEQQEGQMRAIVERLKSMEQEFRYEQEIMWKEMQEKDARINAQAKKIAALDCANTELIRTIASLNRPEDTKPELPDDPSVDSCNASDTSDYKSSSC
ncbi:Disabled 2-interacting protein, partial [Halocaridina rubra]